MSDLPVWIDAHQHFWKYSETDYGWIDDSMAVLRHDFLPADLAAVLEQHGMRGSVAVQARQSEAETDWLLELAAHNERVLGVVGWIGLSGPKLSERLARYDGNPLLKGFRHVLQDEADENFMLQTEFVAGLEKLYERDYSYDILVFARQLPAVEKLISRLPPMRLVIDHIAKPDIASGQWQPWADHIARLAEFPHVYCKLSGMVTEADWGRWQASTFEKYIRHILQCFGPERVMFGSDWPVCTVAAQYAQVVEIVDGLLSREYPQARPLVFGKTAAAFYNL